MKTLVIDGAGFSTLTGFEAAFSEAVLGRPTSWNGNLDVFNDILSGGFGTPDEGFTLVWRNSAKSRKDLGYSETARWYEERLRRAHNSHAAAAMRRGVDAARRTKGETVFDWLVATLQKHGPGGQRAVDGIVLQLE